MKYNFFVLLILLSACKQNKTASPADILHDEVMVIHDKVMPEMKTIHNLKKELEALKTPETDSLIMARVSELNQSDEAMMAWMDKFSEPDGEEAKVTYLQEEKKKITEVNDAVFRSIEKARATIDSLQKK